jgi:hypothetical protein
MTLDMPEPVGPAFLDDAVVSDDFLGLMAMTNPTIPPDLFR